MLAARVAALAAVVALCLAPASSAKGKYWIDVGDSRPRVGQPITVVLHSSWRPTYDLRLFAVAPAKSWFTVVGYITGDASDAVAVIHRDGFQVRLTRVAPNRWRGLVKFPRAGRWQLVEPCGCESGISTPQVTKTIIVG